MNYLADKSFSGYYGGCEDYYTKIHSVKCETVQEVFTGFDFRHNEDVFFTNNTYSTYLYRDKTIDLIKDHDHKKVC